MSEREIPEHVYRKQFGGQEFADARRRKAGKAAARKIGWLTLVQFGGPIATLLAAIVYYLLGGFGDL